MKKAYDINTNDDKVKKIRLTNPADIRRALAWAANAMIKGLITPQMCGKIAYCGAVCLKAYEVNELKNFDERLNILEDNNVS